MAYASLVAIVFKISRLIASAPVATSIQKLTTAPYAKPTALHAVQKIVVSPAAQAIIELFKMNRAFAEMDTLSLLTKYVSYVPLLASVVPLPIITVPHAMPTSTERLSTVAAYV